MRRLCLLTSIFGVLFVLMTLPISSFGEMPPKSGGPLPDSDILNTLESGIASGCTWDLEPAEPDGDVDGSDLFIVAGGNYTEAEFEDVATEFGEANCQIQETDSLTGGMLSSARLYDLRNETAYYCAQAVFLASYLAGVQAASGKSSLISGTLTQSTVSPTEFTYSAGPTDRLRILFADGSEVDYFVIAFEGDFTANAMNFLENAHNLQYRVLIPGELDLTISSQRTRNLNQIYFDVTVSGTFEAEGVTYAANVLYRGDYYHEGDSTGTDTRSNEIATGNLTAPGFELTVNETISSTTISTRDRVSSSSKRTMNNGWTSGGKVYNILNARIQRSFRDGRPHEIDTVWDAQGILLRDGVQIGQLKLGADLTLTFLEVYLATSDGQTILLEKWHM